MQLAKLQAASLALKPCEVQVDPEASTYLGHVISRNGICFSTDRVKFIVDFPTPKSLKKVSFAFRHGKFLGVFHPRLY